MTRVDGRTEQCGDCRFWNVIVAGGSYQGQCKRHAPTRDIHIASRVSYVDADSNQARWPLTREQDGCGDFEPLAVEE